MTGEFISLILGWLLCEWVIELNSGAPFWIKIEQATLGIIGPTLWP